MAPDTNFLTELREADGLLLAVKSNTPRDYDESSPIPFFEEWMAADPEGRVFLSYARDDQALAIAIKAELRAMGYSVFLYRDDDETLLCPGGPCIGRFLSTARHHIAINSPASARSPYVQSEAFWTRGGRVARRGDCLWRWVRESYPNEPDTFIHAQVQRVATMNASIYPSLLTTPDFLDVGWVLGGIAPVDEVMARQNAAGAELAARLSWHADGGAGEVGPPMPIDVKYDVAPDGVTAEAHGADIPKDLDEIVFLDVDRAAEDAMARMPADLDAETRARAADFYVIVQTMLVNSRDPTRFMGVMLQDEPEAAGTAVRLFDMPATQSIHAHLQQYAMAPIGPRPGEGRAATSLRIHAQRHPKVAASSVRRPTVHAPRHRARSIHSRRAYLSASRRSHRWSGIRSVRFRR